MVSICVPSASNAKVEQEAAGLPSSSTVQAPQTAPSHAILQPWRLRSSLRNSAKRPIGRDVNGAIPAVDLTQRQVSLHNAVSPLHEHARSPCGPAPSANDFGILSSHASPISAAAAMNKAVLQCPAGFHARGCRTGSGPGELSRAPCWRIHNRRRAAQRLHLVRDERTKQRRQSASIEVAPQTPESEREATRWRSAERHEATQRSERRRCVSPQDARVEKLHLSRKRDRRDAKVVSRIAAHQIARERAFEANAIVRYLRPGFGKAGMD